MARVVAAAKILGMGVAAVFIAASALAAPLCNAPGGSSPAADGTSRWPAASNCCELLEQQSPSYQCDEVAPGLRGGRRNVVTVVLDDFDYCMNGFMGGRCARDDEVSCSTKRCSNAEWITCTDVADCPLGCGQAPPVCEEVPEACPHGYARQCGEGFPACGDGEICVDGLCSPRADCSVGGSYVCARGLGSCLDPGGGSCEAGETCSCAHQSGVECAQDADCNDTCETDSCIAGTCSITGTACSAQQPCSSLCRATPAPCARNTDCADGFLCTSSTTPLRLNDISCRYRLAGSANWPYDPDTPTTAPVGEQIVHTPTLDALARQGAMFLRARGGGEICHTGRRAILIGRQMRHHHNASERQDGGTRRQCRQPPPPALDEPIGCQPETNGLPSDDCPDSRPCDSLHTPAWWLENYGVCSDGVNRCVKTPSGHELVGTPGSPCPMVGGSAGQCGFAYTIGAGKEHAVSFSVAGFDVEVQPSPTSPLGKFPCDATCENALATGMLPGSATVVGDNHSLYQMIAAVRAAVDADPPTLLPEPIHLYYAPHLPHEHAGVPPSFFLELYGDTGPDPTDDEHLGRASWADSGLEVLFDELKRTCVCGEGAGGPEPQSLFENTTILVTVDQGFLTPEGKGGGGVARENAFRNAMILNAPDHRDPALADPSSPAAAGRPTILDGHFQFASAADILPTILDYAGVEEPADLYPLNESLRPWVTRGMSYSETSMRNYYGHAGDGQYAGKSVPDTIRTYVVLPPDVMGLCAANSNTPTVSVGSAPSHVRPCLTDSDCGGCTSGSGCCVFKAQRCINRPDRRCTEDAECAVCSESQCDSGFTDFDLDGTVPRSCSSDAQCPVPVGACAPPMLKLVQKNGAADRLVDLSADPDETTNLLDLNVSYLGPQTNSCPPGAGAKPYQKLFCCLKEFFELEPVTGLWKPQNFGCPESLREWTAAP